MKVLKFRKKRNGIRIYIPTLGRVDKQVALKFIPPALRGDVCLVAPSSETKALLKHGVYVLACNVKGIAAKRDWILKHAEKMGERKIVMIDDDVGIQRRRKDGRILGISDEEYVQAIEWLARQLDAVAHCGFTHRASAWAAEGTEVVGTRMMNILAYDVGRVLDGGFSFTKGLPKDRPVMEDFHMTLQLLRAGLPNVVSLEWRASPGPSNAAGGCATWRNSKVVEASARALAKFHAPFVKLREKKAWDGMGRTQVDVQVQWKKALASANKSAEAV
jgi:hypothetical protein